MRYSSIPEDPMPGGVSPEWQGTDDTELWLWSTVLLRELKIAIEVQCHARVTD